MKKPLLLFLCLLLSCTNALSQSLHYNITPHFSDAGGYFSIDIEAEHDKDSQDYLLFSKYFNSLSHLYEGENYSLPPATDMLITATGSEFHFSYDFTPVGPHEDPKHPFITNDYFILPAKELLNPFNDNGEWDITISVNLPDNPKMHWTAGTQLDMHFSEKTCGSDFYRLAIVGGNFDIHTFEKPFENVTILFHGEKDPEVKSMFLHNANTLMAHQNAFWEENSSSPYFLNFHKRIVDNKSIQGSHYMDVLTFFYPESAFPNQLDAMVHILSHELFHKWLGIRLNFLSNSKPVHSFSEGMTDYYGLYFATQSGLLQSQESPAALLKYRRDTREGDLTAHGHLTIREWAEHFPEDEPFEKLIKTMVEEQTILTKSNLQKYLSDYLPDEIVPNL